MTTCATNVQHMKEVYDNIAQFDQKHLPEFNKIIKENKHYKLNTLDLIAKMEYFHKFTSYSLEHLIDVINKYPQTFCGYGPYINTDDYWKILPENMNEKKKTLIEYEKKIKEQKKYITDLEYIIEKMECFKIE